MRQLTNKILPLLLLIFCIGIIVTCKQIKQSSSEENYTTDLTLDSISSTLSSIHYPYGICIDSLHINEQVIKPGDHLASIFIRSGFTGAEADGISKKVAEFLDPTKLRAGMNYIIFTDRNNPEKISYMAFAKSLTDYVVIDFTDQEVSAYEYNKSISLKTHYAEGVLSSSLWNTLKNNGADPLLALQLLNVYAWQIDFFDIKEGDSFKVLYDVAYIDDTTALNIANVKGAVFNHKGKDFVAIPFTQDSITEYFDEEGNSLRKAFLKAPLDYFLITSRFSNSRLHPVLKRYRAHHGVDYAAPVGTPVKSIGDGIVIAKGYEGGGGNYVKIKHNSVYTTTYMHLSKFEKGLQVGSRVKQGEVIAYVGSTGLSTGPHLDFRVHKNGTPIDPLQMEAPPSEPVKPELIESFYLAKNLLYIEMDSLRIVYGHKAAMEEKDEFYSRLLSLEQ